MQFNRTVLTVTDAIARTHFFGTFPRGTLLRSLLLQARIITPAAASSLSMFAGLALFRDPAATDSVAAFNADGFNLGHPSAIGLFGGVASSMFVAQDLTTAAGIYISANPILLPLGIELRDYQFLGVLLACSAAAACTIQVSCVIDAVPPVSQGSRGFII